jgi:hypothetical protein
VLGWTHAVPVWAAKFPQVLAGVLIGPECVESVISEPPLALTVGADVDYTSAIFPGFSGFR